MREVIFCIRGRWRYAARSTVIISSIVYYTRISCDSPAASVPLLPLLL